MHQQLQLVITFSYQRIPDEPSKERVDEAFGDLCGLDSFDMFTEQLPPDIRATDFTQVDTSRWKETEIWVEWWKRLHVLQN